MYLKSKWLKFAIYKCNRYLKSASEIKLALHEGCVKKNGSAFRYHTMQN